MQIKIKEVNVENKGKYKVVHVSAVDTNKETDVNKDVVSFGDSADVFTVLSQAKNGDVFDVTAKQNGKYWNWVAIQAATSGNSSTTPTAFRSNPAPNRGNYETPEERAARQVYIVRQSSITAALGLLNLNGVKKATEADVLKSARIFEDFVFDRNEAVSAFKAIEQMEDDIPL